ncbi:MAG: c-type cytochrome [Betaproteobacteria bacterium]|nr:MAG: c-type cytochrome [Betaproteobacteria bacterium]
MTSSRCRAIATHCSPSGSGSPCRRPRRRRSWTGRSSSTTSPSGRGSARPFRSATTATRARTSRRPPSSVGSTASGSDPAPERGARLTCRQWAATFGAALALAGTPPAAAASPVTVRFEGEVKTDWAVEPRTRSVSVARGTIFETLVRVHNRSAQEMVAMVVKEIRPQHAAGAIIHLGCGPTFTLVLKPGEAAAVPVSYFVAEDVAQQVGAFAIAYAVYSFEPNSADPVRVGQRIYAERCVSCHGLQARGDGPTGRFLAGGVSDLTPALRQKEDRILLQVIGNGVGPMPAFSPALNAAELQALVFYLRDLGRRAP